jgi:hypothetical protein
MGLPTKADIRVHLPMLINIMHILGKELQLNPYEELLQRKSSPAEQDQIKKRLVIRCRFTSVSKVRIFSSGTPFSLIHEGIL